jgi:hypothetical protein
MKRYANSDLQLARGTKQGVNKAEEYNEQTARGVQIEAAANEEESAVESILFP